MIEEAQEIFKYLPLTHQSPSEQEYLEFLWEAFRVNYEQEKFPFAFLAYHMIFMCFVYYEIWQIKETRYDDFQKAMIGFNKDIENDLLQKASPFTLSCINESVAFRFLKLIGLENSDIGCFTKIVKNRNDLAHSNGIIFYSTITELDNAIIEIISCVQKIQEKTKDIVELVYLNFLKDSINKDDREYFNPEDQLREVLVRKYRLSEKDIEIALKCSLEQLSADGNYSDILSLSDSLRLSYGELLYG